MKLIQSGHVMWHGVDMHLKAGDEVPEEMEGFLRYKKPMLIGFELAFSASQYRKWLTDFEKRTGKKFEGSEKEKKEELVLGDVKVKATASGTEQFVVVKDSKTGQPVERKVLNRR